MPDNTSIDSVYLQMREMTRPLPPIKDNRGPLVYEVTQDASLNGIDPNYKDKPGAGVHGD